MMKTIEVSDDEARMIDLLRAMAKPKADAGRVVVGVRVVPAAAGTGLDIAVDYELRQRSRVDNVTLRMNRDGEAKLATARGRSVLQNWKPGA